MSDAAPLAPALARVLLIDDDDLSRELLELLLVGDGYAVEAAASGEKGLALLGCEPKGGWVVLADLQMPGLCGAALAEALRGTPGVEVLVAMSGSDPRGGAAAGYDAFLRKPFSMEQFASVLEAVARNSTALPGSLASVAAAATYVDAASNASDLRAPEPEVLDEGVLARLQASMTPPQLEDLFRFALEDGECQLEVMRAAAAVADEEQYRRAAHSLKGSFGMLGAPELQGMAGMAEREGCPERHSEVTTFTQFSDAFVRLRLTLVARGVCRC